MCLGLGRCISNLLVHFCQVVLEMYLSIVNYRALGANTNPRVKCVRILLPQGNLKALLNSPGVLEPLGMAVPEPLPASKYSRLEIYRALPRPKNVNIVGARSTRVFQPHYKTASRAPAEAEEDRSRG